MYITYFNIYVCTYCNWAADVVHTNTKWKEAKKDRACHLVPIIITMITHKLKRSLNSWQQPYRAYVEINAVSTTGSNICTE